ncbi:MAG TPA: PilT/PilU family type 4a pilus ATPase [Candidatus Paceibacterota bacterium]|nr:PilT/PilU family type 4a pilus ATPase [Candidatus Paceibacterota bacterium]
MATATLLKGLLDAAIKQDASDLHITVGRPPTLRVYGALAPLDGKEALGPASTESIISEMMTADQKARFLENRQLDFTYSLASRVRFRVSAYFQQGYWAASLRLVPAEVRTIEQLNLPPVLHDFAKLAQGFVLMVGPAGHGKSTTTAAILDEINQSRTSHIVTIEDPIEYLFTPGNGLVSQREVGGDVHSFGDGLKTVLRQDPDVIMVGEMRDPESISAALTAAETGHLVFSTLHTNSASQTVDRIIDSFPAAQQPQVIAQLATTLVAIVSERLVPRADGKGRIPAMEVMITNPAIRNLIREKKVFSIDSVIQTGGDEGMVSLNNSLMALIKSKAITAEHAVLFSNDPSGLKKML